MKRSKDVDEVVEESSKRRRVVPKVAEKEKKKYTFDEDLYLLMVDLRARRDAPVDTCGAEALPDSSDPIIFQFQTLMSLMLSSQTRDQVTAAAIKRMKTDLHPPGLSLESVLNATEEQLAKVIMPVSFYNNKARNIKKTAKMIQEEFGGKVPNDLEKLMSLPGVGPKMAHLTIQVAFKDCSQGIGVDTHVHRICNQVGFVHTNTPEETRIQLQKTVPKKYWGTINYDLVGLGQQIKQKEERVKLLRQAICIPGGEIRQTKALNLLERLGLNIKSIIEQNQYKDEFEGLIVRGRNAWQRVGSNYNTPITTQSSINSSSSKVPETLPTVKKEAEEIEAIDTTTSKHFKI